VHSHHHGHDPTSRRDRRRPRKTGLRARILLALIVLPLVGATGYGLWELWPPARGANTPSMAVPGTTFPKGEVQSVRRMPCAEDPQAPAPAAGGPSTEGEPGQGQAGEGGSALVCGTASVRVAEGADSGRSVEIDVPPDVMSAGLTDEVILVRTPAQGDLPVGYSLQDLQRGTPLAVLAVAFGAVVVLIARMRGFLALLGLGFAAVVMGTFILPALLAGSDPILVGLTGSAAIMLVVLYLAHGLSARTTTALLGTFAGLGATAAIAMWSVRTSHLTGLSSDENSILQQVATQLSPRDLLLAGIMLAGLGVLNDVTITQSSAVWELHDAAPGMRAGELFSKAMRIGRDHIASTIYTIVFAYAGAALPVLLLIELYAQPLSFVLTSNDIAEEIVRTLASAIGLVLAVPLTTALAAMVAVTERRPAAQPEAGDAVPVGA
jgi:uncharacterized membrane protein